MKTVFEINDYREACKFLQDKYDALGYVRKDYYHTTGADHHLTKTSGISHGADGLQYHHICEDIVPSLSDKTNAELYFSEHPEYQSADNMCYCNLLEHAWLHILITEQNVESAENAEEDVTGNGGVAWMILALNSIYTNTDTSWYSSKNEDGKGMNYNHENVITDNRAIFEKIVNRYCTSAFIRQRLNMSNKELAMKLASLKTKKDENILSNIDDIMKIAEDTYLFDWNVGAFADLLGYLKTDRSALIQICTGGGKTTTALEYMRISGLKTLVVGPGDTIKEGWEKNDAVKRFGYRYVNYQTLMNRDYYKSLATAGYELIICDEAHHLGAERWSEGVEYLMANTNAKLIGLTATPTEEQLNGKDKYFNGRICYGLNLAEGITSGELHAFDYITSIYKMDDVKADFDKYGAVGTQLWGRLNLELNASPVQKIMKKHMPAGQRKIIVFCSSKEDLDYARDVMIAYDPKFASEEHLRSIFSDKDKDYNKDAKKWFNDADKEDVCLLTVAMVNEGAHYNGVNTLVMFRRTNSATLYLQQLGRVIVTKNKPNPHGIVFDFTNNAESLIVNTKVEIWEEAKDKTAASEAIRKVKEAIKKKAEQKEVICQDYTQDCASVLAALRDTKDSTRRYGTIYAAFQNVGLDLGLDLAFNMDYWSELKTKSASKKVTLDKKTSGHAKSESVEKALDEATKGVTTRRTVVDASDAEKLATAFALAIRRMYMCGVIDFTDNSQCQLIVHDQSTFDKITKSLGFTEPVAFEFAADKLSVQAYIIATKLD